MAGRRAQQQQAEAAELQLLFGRNGAFTLWDLTGARGESADWHFLEASV